MTREETVKWLESLKAEIGKSEHRTLWHYAEAIDMAIEALSAETVSREDTVTLNSPISIQAEMVAVVRCKDCRHRDLFSCPLADNDFQKDEDFCSWGERREPTIPMFAEAEDAYKEWTGEDIGCKSFTADEWYRNNFKDGEAE